MFRKRIIKLAASLAVIILTLLSVGCSSIFSKSQYPVSIDSNPSGAIVTVKNQQGVDIKQVTTPSKIKLSAKAGFFKPAKYTFLFKKEGYKSNTKKLWADLDGWYFGNFVCGGLIGFVIVDPLTGSMWKLDNNVFCDLAPITDTIYSIDTDINNEGNISDKTSELEVIAYKFDAKTNSGFITIDIKGKGIGARHLIVENIGKICSDKNITMIAGQETHKNGGYRVLNESVTNGLLTIEFEATF